MSPNLNFPDFDWYKKFYSKKDIISFSKQNINQLQKIFFK